MLRKFSTPIIATVFALCCAAELGPVRAAGVPPSRPVIKFTGHAILDGDELSFLCGRPPRAQRRWEAWARGARRKILRRYRGKGYRIARVWFRVEPLERRIHLHIDEGRIHRLEVRGGGVIARLVARSEVALPYGVYHRNTVRRAMKRLREVPALQYAYTRVVKTRELEATPLGTLVNKRILRVFAVTREPTGLQFSTELSPRFGLWSTLGYALPNVVGKRDRFAAELQIAPPVRRYYYEDAQRGRWVAGRVGLGYRFHPIHRSDFTFGVTTEAALNRDSRQDVGYRNVMDVNWRGAAEIGLMGKGPFVLSTSIGAAYRQAMLRYEDPAGALAETPSAQWQFQWRTRLEVDYRPTILRLDDANRVRLDTVLSVTPTGEVSGRIGIRGSLVANYGAHQVRGSLDGFTTLGDTYFWDMEPVAGTLQRAHFGGRLWTHRGAHIELAYRFRVARQLQLGIVHDLSGFERGEGAERQVFLVNGVGPTAHVTFLGLVSVDVGYVFGFVLLPLSKPVSWTHNLTFRLSTAF